MSDQSPIACDLTAIDDAERVRHRRAAEATFTSVEDVRELRDGYGFRLPTDTETIQRAGTFISQERLCCPFFDFTLEVEPDRGPVWLNITGREGVKAFVEEAVLPHWEFDADES